MCRGEKIFFSQCQFFSLYYIYNIYNSSPLLTLTGTLVCCANKLFALRAKSRKSRFPSGEPRDFGNSKRTTAILVVVLLLFFSSFLFLFFFLYFYFLFLFYIIKIRTGLCCFRAVRKNCHCRHFFLFSFLFSSLFFFSFFTYYFIFFFQKNKNCAKITQFHFVFKMEFHFLF